VERKSKVSRWFKNGTKEKTKKQKRGDVPSFLPQGVKLLPGRKEILILGVGNVLLGDEGVGVHLIEELEKIDLPPTVELVDGGTAAFDLIPYFQEKKRVIILDALKVSDSPGSVYRFEKKDLLEWRDFPPLSLHQVELPEIFNLLRLLGQEPERIVIIGVVPKEPLSWGCNLSDEVRDKLPSIINIILKEVVAP